MPPAKSRGAAHDRDQNAAHEPRRAAIADQENARQPRRPETKDQKRPRDRRPQTGNMNAETKSQTTRGRVGQRRYKLYDRAEHKINTIGSGMSTLLDGSNKATSHHDSGTRVRARRW